MDPNNLAIHQNCQINYHTQSFFCPLASGFASFVGTDVMTTLDVALLCSSRVGSDLGCESGLV